MTAPSSPSLRDTLLTALAPCVWGSTYIVTTELLPPGRPLLAAMMRTLPVGLVMLAWGRTLPRGGDWWRAFGIGILNIGIFQALLFLGAYRLPGGVASVLTSTQPLMVVLLSWLMLSIRPSRIAWIAGVGGVIGVALLVLTPAARLDAIGVIASLLSAASMAVGTTLTKRWQPQVSVVTLTAWQLTAGGLALLPATLMIEGPVPAMTGPQLAGYAYLSFIGCGLTYAIWFRGLGRLSASSVTLLLLLAPISANVIGLLALHQHLTPAQWLGFFIVLASVWLGQRPDPSRPGGKR